MERREQYIVGRGGGANSCIAVIVLVMLVTMRCPSWLPWPNVAGDWISACSVTLHYPNYRVRRSTWDRLKFLSASSLSEILEASLQRDPLAPILTRPHLEAIDRRLDKTMATIKQCVVQHSQDVVVVDSWD